jgi:hypothetical protein
MTSIMEVPWTPPVHSTSGSGFACFSFRKKKGVATPSSGGELSPMAQKVRKAEADTARVFADPALQGLSTDQFAQLSQQLHAALLAVEDPRAALLARRAVEAALVAATAPAPIHQRQQQYSSSTAVQQQQQHQQQQRLQGDTATSALPAPLSSQGPQGRGLIQPDRGLTRSRTPSIV